MTERVIPDRVPLSRNLLDKVPVASRRLADHEECGACMITVEYIQHLWRLFRVWPVIER
jgi:hypothetical protein